MAESGREPRVPPSASETVASFATYAEATRAVDYLADRRLPLGDLAVLAMDFRIAQSADRSATYATAGAGGAISGAAIGTLVALVLGAFDASVLAGWEVVRAFAACGIGAVVGTAIAVFEHGVSREAGRRTAVRSLRARRYDVLAKPGMADAARTVLDELAQRSPA